MQGKRGRVARGAQHGGVAQADAGRQGQHPFMRHARKLRIAAIAIHADAKAVHHHGLPRRKRGVGGAHDGAAQVDAADAGVRTDDVAAPRLGQRVFVVQAGVRDLDHRVACG
jgi:hypothetical protein